MSLTGWPQKKRPKPKRKIIAGPGKLVLREKDRPIVPIEEIRGKGLMMASHGFGEDIRFRHSTQDRKPKTSSRQTTEPVHLDSRRAVKRGINAGNEGEL